MVDVEKNIESAPISLAWRNLTFQVNGKTILFDVSGCLASGQMLAVMGPSGASCAELPTFKLIHPPASTKVPESPRLSMYVAHRAPVQKC
jgi:hypothetical protein